MISIDIAVTYISLYHTQTESFSNSQIMSNPSSILKLTRKECINRKVKGMHIYVGTDHDQQVRSVTDRHMGIY